MQRSAFAGLLVSVITLAAIASAAGEFVGIQAELSQLSQESQNAFVGLDMTQPKDFGPILRVVDDLIGKLRDDRKKILKEQEEAHARLREVEKDRDAKCARSAELKNELEMVLSDYAAAQEQLVTIKEELMLALSVKAKNLKANEAVREIINKEKYLISHLLIMVENMNKIQMHTDQVDGIDNKQAEDARLKHDDEIKQGAKKITELLQALTLTSDDEKKAIMALDAGRSHGETITIKKMLEDMLAEHEKALKEMLEQEKRDAEEVVRLEKLVEEGKAKVELKRQARDESEKDYQIALNNCEVLSGKYHEALRLLIEEDKIRTEKIKAINKELVLLNEMRRKIASYMKEPDFAVKVKEMQDEEAKYKKERAEAWAKAKAAGVSQYEFERDEAEKLAKKMADKRAAEDKAKAEEVARIKAEEEAAAKEEADARAAIAQSQKNLEQAKEDVETAKRNNKEEHDRKTDQKQKDALHKLEVEKRKAAATKKVLQCIKLIETAAKDILNMKVAPVPMVKECAKLEGNEEQMMVGVRAMMKTSMLYRKRQCKHKINELFHKLMSRKPEEQTLKYYVHQCAHGLTMEEISDRLKMTEEYRARVDKKFRAEWCTRHVGQLFERWLKRKPEPKELLYYSGECLKGRSLEFITTILRRLPEYKSVLAKEYYEKKANRKEYEAKQRALAAARYKAKQELWKKEHMHALDARREEEWKKKQLRAKKHEKEVAEMKKRKELYDKWCKTWCDIRNDEQRNEWWTKLTRSTRDICHKQTQYCKSSTDRDAAYNKLRKSEQDVINQYNKNKQDCAAFDRAEKASEYAKCLKHGEELKEEAATLANKAKSLRARKSVGNDACKEQQSKCRVATHRFFSILKCRVSWERARADKWDERAKNEMAKIDEAESDDDKEHHEAQLKFQQGKARKHKEMILKLESIKDKWAETVKEKQQAAWQEQIEGWKKEKQCEVREAAAAGRLHTYYGRSLKVAKETAATRSKILYEAKEATSPDNRDKLVRKANNSLKRYHEVLHVAKDFYTREMEAKHKQFHCERKAKYLIRHFRERALAQAKALAAKHVKALEKAQADYKKAKEESSGIEHAKKELEKAVKLAKESHAALEKAQDLVKMSTKAEAEAAERQKASEQKAREAAASKLKAASGQWAILQHAEAKAKADYEKKKKEEAEAKKRDEEYESKKKQDIKDWRARRRLIRTHGAKYAFATASGDPHIKALNGRVLNLNALGDFVLVKAADFECQARAVSNNKKIGASHIVAVACQLPGNGDVVEITKEEVALNRRAHKFKSGSTVIQGGTFLNGQDKNGIHYFKLSMSNGIFVEVNTDQVNGAINVIAAIPATLVHECSGVFAAESAEEEKKGKANAVAAIQEAHRPFESLFSTKAAVGQKAFSESQNLVQMSSLKSAEEVCKQAFSGLGASWTKCSSRCRESKAFPGHCLFMDKDMDELSRKEQRACDCMYDVAVAGDTYAKTDAYAAELEDEAMHQVKLHEDKHLQNAKEHEEKMKAQEAKKEEQKEEEKKDEKKEEEKKEEKEAKKEEQADKQEIKKEVKEEEITCPEGLHKAPAGMDEAAFKKWYADKVEGAKDEQMFVAYKAYKLKPCVMIPKLNMAKEGREAQEEAEEERQQNGGI